jgi:hypothetical protein
MKVWNLPSRLVLLLGGREKRSRAVAAFAIHQLLRPKMQLIRNKERVLAMVG